MQGANNANLKHSAHRLLYHLLSSFARADIRH